MIRCGSEMTQAGPELHGWNPPPERSPCIRGSYVASHGGQLHRELTTVTLLACESCG